MTDGAMGEFDIEKIFRRAGAPWPPSGNVHSWSLYDALALTDPLKAAGWERSFFRHALGIDAEEHTTNLVKPHEYPHPYVVVRVGLNFEEPGSKTTPDETLRWLQPRLRVTAYVALPAGGAPWVRMERTPFYVGRDSRVMVTMTCAPGVPPPGPPASPLYVRCMLDSLVVR